MTGIRDARLRSKNDRNFCVIRAVAVTGEHGELI